MANKKRIFQRIKDFIFGEIVVVQNDFFGDMIDAGDYYECRRIFEPTGKVVEIGLEKNEKESVENQMNFFKWIECNYELIIQKVSPVIEERVAGWITNYQIQNFKKEFILEYLYIPKCDEKIFDWQISFYANNELQHWCSLDMNGLEVKQILIDG